MRIGSIGALALCAAMAAPAAHAKSIEWSGHVWKVRPSGLGDPGPDNWSNSKDNVWVDSNGLLHLKITHVGDKWYAVELESAEKFGFGTYNFWVDTRVDNLDPNVVLGFFNYPLKHGLDGTNEIDIEFGQWGDPKAPQLDYVVYPAKAGPGPSGWGFHVTDTSTENTQRFTWTDTSVHLQSLAGYQNGDEGEYATWTFAPKGPHKLVPQTPMPVHINLWLSGGLAPDDGQEKEVVIRSFTFTPAD